LKRLASGGWPKTVIVVALGIVLVLAGNFLLSPREAERALPEFQTALETQGEDAEISVVQAEGNPAENTGVRHAPPVGTREDARHEDTPVGLVLGVVESPSGEGVAGATVTWTSAKALSARMASSPMSWEELRNASVSSKSDSSGKFRLRPPSELGKKGVVWASALGFRSGFLAVADSMSSEALSIALQGAESVTVTVKDEVGNAVQGAAIRMTGYRGASLSLAQEGARPVELQAFSRVAITGSDGRAIVPGDLEFARLVAVTADGATSPALLTALRSDAELRVGRTLEVRGRVLGLPNGGHALATIYFVPKVGRSSFLECLDVDSGGAILPGRVPSLSDGEYEVWVEGANTAPVITRWQPPEGDVLEILVDVEPPSLLEIAVMEPDGTAIAGAKVRYGWYTADGVYRTTKAVGESDSDGFLQMACYEGPVFLTTTHPKYVAREVEQEAFAPSVPGRPVSVVMIPFATLDGVVHHNGKPVHDFDIYSYAIAPEVDMRIELVRGAEQGQFHLERVPLDDVQLFVVDARAGGGGAQSEPVTVAPKGESFPEIDVEVPLGQSGIGRVLTAMGAVPAGVNVTRSLRTAGKYPWQSNDVIDVRVDGFFTVTGLSGSRESVWITAPGFSPALLDATRRDRDSYQFGTAILSSFSTLELAVVMPPGADHAGFRLGTTGMVWAEAQVVPSDGLMVFPEATPGFTNVHVDLPSGTSRDYELRLRGRGPWKETIDVSGRGTVLLQVASAKDQLPDGLYVTAIWREGAGAPEASFAVDLLEPELLLTELQSQPTTFTLHSADGLVLDRVRATPGLEGEVVVSFQFDKPKWSLVVVNLDGLPMPDVRIDCWSLSDIGAIRKGKTGPEGVAEMGLIDGGPYHLMLISPDGRHCGNITVEDVRPSDSIRIEFHAEESMTVRALDGSDGLSGVELWIFDSEMNSMVGWPRLDESGEVIVSGLSEGDYVLEPQTPMIWAETRTVHCDGTGKIQEVQFRRKAQVRVVVTDAYGNPAAGVAVGLRSVEYDTDVAVWLGDGRAESANGLVTDANGEVLVSEVPRGVYSWSVGTQSGQVDAPALGVGLVEVALKP